MRRHCALLSGFIAGASAARLIEEALPGNLRRLRDRGLLTEHQAQQALRGAAYVSTLPEILESCQALPVDAPATLRGALSEDDSEDTLLDSTLLDDGPCFVPNYKYMPANMPNQGRTVEETVLGCQSRCRTTRGCAHFTYWPNRGCHLQSYEAKKEFAAHVTAGPPDCDERHLRMKSCFTENMKYEPKNMEGQDRLQVGSVLECQKRCRQTEGCEYFSYWPDGGCHLQDASATQVPARRIISGPGRCLSSFPQEDVDLEINIDDAELLTEAPAGETDSHEVMGEPEKDALGVADGSQEADLIPQHRAVALVLTASKYVAEGILDAKDFEREVNGCSITTVKEAEFEQLRQLAKFLRREEVCPDDEPHQLKVPDPLADECQVPDNPWEQRVLSRMAVLQRIKKEKVNATLQHCECAEPAPELLTSRRLLDIVSSKAIPRSPLMMRDAAKHICTQNSYLQNGMKFTVVFNNACAADGRGYCCEARDFRWIAGPLKLRGDELAEASLVHTMGLAESLRTDSEKIYRKFLSQMENWYWVKTEQKVLFYKMYIIYYHHVRLAIERQQYCVMNPEDLATCEDPINLYFSIKTVRNEILQTHRALFEYGSCLQTGTRTLGAAVAGDRPVAAKVRGIAGILFRRAVHVLGTGQIQRRVNKAVLSLARSAWTHRFEIIFVSLVLGAGQPLMQALTATGVSTGTATSWSLILEQFMRNMFVHVGCPILSSPLLMAMLVRWSMNKIILTEFFINNAIQPLWELAKKVLSPLTSVLKIKKEVFDTSIDVIKALLRSVRSRQGSNETAADDGPSDRRSWVEAAREFHATAAADVLYAFVSLTFGVAWRALATAACTAAKLALPVINGAEAGVDWGFGKAAAGWSKLAEAASGFIKRGTKDTSLPFVESMVAEDAKVQDAAKNIPSKTLAAIHKLLGKGSIAMSTGLDKSLDVFGKVLDMMGQTTIFLYGLSSALSFAVLRVWQPGQDDLSSDDLMMASLGAKLDEANADACRGKKQGASCVYLQFAGFSNETVSQGSCCRGTCSMEPCNVGPEEAEAEQDFAVQNVSLNHLRRQSKFLYGFINLARKGYGGFCKEHES